MKISKASLQQAVKENILSEEAAVRLIHFIKNTSRLHSLFSFTHVLYYLGGLVAIGAMSLFMNLAWSYGGYGLLLLSLSYALLCLALTHTWDQKGLYIPAGISATLVICLTPLGIFGWQLIMGWWPSLSPFHHFDVYLKWNWIFMELGTLLVGLILTAVYRYPFMLMPISITLWYLTMDLTDVFYSAVSNVAIHALISVGLGLVMIFTAFLVDIRSRRHLDDYAFWLYFIGVLLFWSGLSYHQANSEWSRFFYFCTNLIMIAIGVILGRKVFLVFGTFGLCLYLSYLSFEVFRYSYLFPVALSSIGFGIIYLGILWQKKEDQLTHALRSILPRSLQELLQARE